MIKTAPHSTLFPQMWCIRQQSPFQDTYKKCKDTYIPQQCSTPEYCFCGISFRAVGTCIFCGSALSQEIAACVAAGKITTKMRRRNEGESKYCKLLHQNPFLRNLWNVALTCQGWGHAGLFK